MRIVFSPIRGMDSTKREQTTHNLTLVQIAQYQVCFPPRIYPGLRKGRRMTIGKVSRKALLERAKSLRQQAEEAGDLSIKDALETVARGYEILAEKAPDDEADNADTSAQE